MGEEPSKGSPGKQMEIFFPLRVLREAAQRANRKGRSNPDIRSKEHATAVVTLPSFLLVYVSLQVADLIAELASLSHAENLPRTCIVQPRPGASAADRT